MRSSMLIPYNDPQYRDASADDRDSRRPMCCRSAAIDAGVALGLHPRLTGLRTIFNAGRLAFIQRTGYENSSRSHFEGTDIWSTGDPRSPQGNGWLGRYLDTLPSPVDPLTAWSTAGRDSAHAAGEPRRRAVDSDDSGICVRQPEHGR